MPPSPHPLWTNILRPKGPTFLGNPPHSWKKTGSACHCYVIHSFEEVKLFLKTKNLCCFISFIFNSNNVFLSLLKKVCWWYRESRGKKRYFVSDVFHFHIKCFMWNEVFSVERFFRREFKIKCPSDSLLRLHQAVCMLISSITLCTERIYNAMQGNVL